MNLHRRRLLQAGGALLSGGVAPAWPAELVPTPAQMRGPFYPVTFPLDRDNDLVRVEGRPGLAFGEITHITGRVLNTMGLPQAGVRIEIWQVNGYGRYHHEGDAQDRPFDPNFQGYGICVTAPDGSYGFRTVRPVAYPGRAPHVHFALSRADFGTFTTQMYVAGAPENDNDLLLSRVRDRQARESLVVSLSRSGSPPAELAGKFDIILARDGRMERGEAPAYYRDARGRGGAALTG
jgi:protocatechuate 3,4-dioxygenase, beta subunit